VSFLAFEWVIGLQINWVGPDPVDLEIIYYTGHEIVALTKLRTTTTKYSTDR
jgi:hypothetical protein